MGLSLRMGSAFASASFVIVLSSHAPQNVIVVRFLAVCASRSFEFLRFLLICCLRSCDRFRGNGLEERGGIDFSFFE